MDNKKYEISIPGIFFASNIANCLLKLLKRFPEKFYDDFYIGSVYGSFPCIWNGGRVLDGSFEIEDVKDTVEYLNSQNIAVRYTFTNNLLEAKHLNDRIGNQILKTTLKYQTRQNDINVGCETMLHYIEEKYPEFNIVLSTTFCINNPEEINKQNQKYIIVPDYQINNKWNELAKIKKPENIEILLNDTCLDSCPFRRKHYEANSRFNLKIDNKPTSCFYQNGNSSLIEKETPFHHVKREDFEKYYNLGINKFKITGRGLVGYSWLITGICEYLVKPEAKSFIEKELIKEGSK